METTITQKKTYVYIPSKRKYGALKQGITIESMREKYPDIVKCGKCPSLKTLEKWSWNSYCKTPDGCKVEPDGKCPHGQESWMIILGLI